MALNLMPSVPHRPPSKLGLAAVAGWAAVFCLAAPSYAGGFVTFGSGPNQFSIEFVTINGAAPGNAADTDVNARPVSATLGVVGYRYGIAKYEGSEDMIAKYNALNPGLAIQTLGLAADKPAGVSWNSAARFVNWLNTSQGYAPAYKFTTSGVNDNIALWTSADVSDYDPSNQYRSRRARFVLPDYNEWYKAAFYNPANSTYYNYAYGFDSAPTQVCSGTTANTSVYTFSTNPYTCVDTSQSPYGGAADVNLAGGLSPYGVMGLGGNLREIQETAADLTNNDPAENRFDRGGSWGGVSSRQLVSITTSISPTAIPANDLGGLPTQGFGRFYGGIRVINLDDINYSGPGAQDAGVGDAGLDAGVDDAGVDAGLGTDDAGADAGLGTADAGVDAGLGTDDAGVDAGLGDDAGSDAGTDRDGGVDVDGERQRLSLRVGCGCSPGDCPPGVWWPIAIGLLMLARWRSSR